MRKKSKSGGEASVNFLGCRLEKLEDRCVPASVVNHIEVGDLAPNYLPPSQHLVNVNGFLTGPQTGDRGLIALDFIRNHAAELGLSEADAQHYVITDYYTDQDNVATTHMYLRQTFNGLTVANANMNINVMRNGQVLNLGSTFYGGLSAWETYPAIVPTPGLTAAQALISAASQLGMHISTSPAPIETTNRLDQRQTILSQEASQDPIAAHLAYIVTPDGAHLSWNMILRTPDGDHWYDAYADTNTGALLWLADWSDHAAYEVFAIPTESPNHGPRTTVFDPADPAASPFGWHDTDGVIGAEYTDTRGNNVYAQEDGDANDSGGFRPNGNASLDFSFALDLSQSPSFYQDAAITNLFYWNNVLHDVHYQYGFTPAAGNFQVNNYGSGGLGGDAVNADAQDGSGTNNANFDTPPDGIAPRMQQYVFTVTSPRRDSDLDTGVIVHEYGHGVSNRLTGGPANSSALDARQSGGMGEGWSDFYALMFTQEPTDAQFDAYPMGAYVLGQPNNGGGIRRKPYSFDMSINNQTIGLYNSSNEVHNAGELWCDALWDLNWLLINKFGYDSNLYTGYAPGGGPASAGNKLVLRLVADAMKLQPANPSFVDGRNAILAADQALTNGANKAQIWQAFARRGMGVSFTTASANSTTVTEAFDVPYGLAPIGDTVVSVDQSNNLVINDVAAGGKNDALTIIADMANARYIIGDGANLVGTIIPGATGNGTHSVYVPFSAATGAQIQILMGGGNDAVTVDNSLGTFIKAIVVNGAAGADSLSVSGTAAADAFAVNSTSISFASFGLTYSNIESVGVDGAAAGDTFNVTPAATTALNIYGNNPTHPSLVEADWLNLNLAGVSGQSLAAGGNGTGTWSFSSRLAVTFFSIERMTPGVSISGRVFNDLNYNGTDNGGADPGMTGVTVNLDSLADGVADLSTTSGVNGAYAFTDLAPGLYRIRQVVPATYTQTSVNPADILSTAPLSNTGRNFGNAIVDNTAPTITGLFIDGSTWTSAFRSAAGDPIYGYPAQTGAGQLTSMPWSTVDTIYVKFSENVNIDSVDLGVRGLNVASYSIGTFSYDSVNFVAKFVLTAAVDTDRLIFDLDGNSATAVADPAGNKLAGTWTEAVSAFPTTGAAGVDFQYRVVVAVGDADRNNLVRNADVNLVRANLFVDAGAGGYSIYRDIDGNGQTRNADVNIARSHLFVDPPPGPGPNRPRNGTARRGAGMSLGHGPAIFTGPPVANEPPQPSTTRRPVARISVQLLDAIFAEA